MYDLTRFALSDMTECGAALRQLGRDAESMEEVANRIVRHLYDQFLDPQTGEQSCVLVRLFKTHPFGELDAELQRFARDLLGRPPESPAMKCLTLLATVGARPEWNSRRSSAGHRAIPLTSELVVPQFPMIVQLIHQFGLEFNTVLRPDPAPLLDLKQRAYDVFHVPQALGSPYIPAQDEFVIPFGVRSVLGFGGMLPTGDLFAVILFSRAPIARDTADLFQALALSVKVAILPFAQVVFAGGKPATGGGDVLGRNNQADELALRLGARAAALEQSLEMHEQIVRAQAGELERALAEFRNVLESAPDAIVITSDQGRIVRLNRQAEAIFGYTREELLGEPVEILMPERFRERHPKHRAAYSPKSRPRPMGTGLELYGRRKDGGEFPVDITLSPMEIADGFLIISVIRDITYRRRTEEQLVKLSRAVEQSANLVIIADTQGRIEYVNPNFTQVTGYTPDEVIGQNPRILKSGKTSPEEFRRLWETITSGREWRGEFLNKMKNGELCWASASISPIRNHQGVITHFVAIEEDISELKRAEEALRASERRYRQLTEATLDAIVVADERGVISLFNAAAQRTFGYSEQEVLGQPLTILMPPEYHEAHQRGLRHYLETREARVVGRTIELRGRRKDGEVFPLELSLSAVELPEGIYFLGAIRDLTERQRMQARLVQAEKLASLGLMSAGVAHEINNPLAYVANNLAVLERAIRGLTALVAAYEAAQAILESARPDLAAQVAQLAAEIDLPYVKEHIEHIVSSTRQGVKRVADIVQNLRGFARLDQAAVERVNLHDAITSSLEMIRGRLGRRHIVVEQQFGDLPLVMCTPAQINQVFLNLLVNALQAIEATSKGGGRIEIRTRAAGDEVIVEVADDGLGIPADLLPRIFDPFFTTKAVGEGSGLGLSISHGIVSDHGGRIEVESTPGQGSRFRVILPIRGKGRVR